MHESVYVSQVMASVSGAAENEFRDRLIMCTLNWEWQSVAK